MAHQNDQTVASAQICYFILNQFMKKCRFELNYLFLLIKVNLNYTVCLVYRVFCICVFKEISLQYFELNTEKLHD